MEKIESKIRFGLIGKDIDYSFSRAYFTQKFKDLNLDTYSYENFDFQDIKELDAVLKSNSNIKGFNVTIPYKEEVFPFLSSIDEKAKEIGAVNTIKYTEDGLKGYNTDYYGFQKSIEPFIKEHHKKALILGTGGASKAIAFVFKEFGIEYTFVSRRKKENQFTYQELTQEIIEDYTVIVNCSPVGTFPDITKKPAIPYQFIGKKHLLFDLIYNPEKTAFLASGEARGAQIKNGDKMLELQAEKAWEIWNS
ncbi:Shikimate dehydrogenase substrate binding domain protein [Cellulophaga algicola DSM 14237]|uniref:Shikimate dehydrogenase substrate binding domain protein n=1 Tax=Cellulophaga algicola (strain DSM 14237 / IC166 / ACAM 630) TaxID=688270 RepID=E6XC05_CELAD|nr:shikimate dehydrogenase [Cellulophaga algicola]ADV50010.1 Shikimate dehydrogenase substrate binding domain protein [Cellulophaga algicola DSM 14237]